MRAVGIALGTVVALVVAGLGVMHAGIFDVSTAWRDPALLRWVLVTTREASIERRARDIRAPDLTAADRVERGFRAYRDRCEACHGRPGGAQTPLAKGLNPEPPNLGSDEDHMSPAELFWVVKNGIRMTGMPAWGPSATEDELWDVVAFVRALPTMSATQYRALDSNLPPGGDSR